MLVVIVVAKELRIRFAPYETVNQAGMNGHATSAVGALSKKLGFGSCRIVYSLLFVAEQILASREFNQAIKTVAMTLDQLSTGALVSLPNYK